MWTERLARDIGVFGRAHGGGPECALDRMSAAAARGVPGCSAALVAIWRDLGAGVGPAARRHVVVDYGASHSDLASAFEHQYTTDEGPTVESVREMRPVRVADVLREDRWPRYLSTAAQCGDRASVTFPCALEGELAGEVVTFGVHAGRADALDGDTVTPLVALLAEHAAMALHSTGRYAHVAREAAHMRRALSVRAVIDQAKGILMHAHGCGATEAFEELRGVAQRNRMKVADLARRLVEEHAASTGGEG